MIVDQKSLRNEYQGLGIELWFLRLDQPNMYTLFVFIFDSLWIDDVLLLIRNVLAPKFLLMDFLLDFFNVIKIKDLSLYWRGYLKSNGGVKYEN